MGKNIEVVLNERIVQAWCDQLEFLDEALSLADVEVEQGGAAVTAANK